MKCSHYALHFLIYAITHTHHRTRHINIYRSSLWNVYCGKFFHNRFLQVHRRKSRQTRQHKNKTVYTVQELHFINQINYIFEKGIRIILYLKINICFHTIQCVKRTTLTECTFVCIHLCARRVIAVIDFTL